MKLRMRFADQIVGVFVLLALVGIAVMLVFIGINQRWFARNYHFTSSFKTADGISAGMPIMMKGFAIGKVVKVSVCGSNSSAASTELVSEKRVA